MFRKAFLIMALFCFPLVVNAQLDAYDQEALQKTQELLKNSVERNQAIQKDDKAKAVDKHVQQMFGGDAQATDDIYKLAAELFADLAKDSKGDPEAMKKFLEEFHRDPAAFAKQWTPEQLHRLKELSNKVKVAPSPNGR